MGELAEVQLKLYNDYKSLIEECEDAMYSYFKKRWGNFVKSVSIDDLHTYSVYVEGSNSQVMEDKKYATERLIDLKGRLIKYTFPFGTDLGG